MARVTVPLSPRNVPLISRGSHAWRWTVAKYFRAGELGFFDGRRVELIEGRVIEMAPQHEPHVAAVVRSDLAVAAAFGEGYHIRRQAPLNLSSSSAPEPDVAVVPGHPDDYLRSGAPTSALLIIEVSDKTLLFDRGKKLALYARHGIQDYWIVNLVDWRLEIYRQPAPDPSSKRRYGYVHESIHNPGQDVSPLAKPDAKIQIAHLLPPFRPS